MFVFSLARHAFLAAEKNQARTLIRFLQATPPHNDKPVTQQLDQLYNVAPVSVWCRAGCLPPVRVCPGGRLHARPAVPQMCVPRWCCWPHTCAPHTPCLTSTLLLLQHSCSVGPTSQQCQQAWLSIYSSPGCGHSSSARSGWHAWACCWWCWARAYGSWPW